MKWILVIFCCICSMPAQAQFEGVGQKIDSLLEGKQLKIGIALCDLDSSEEFSIRGNESFPMQSVFKFPIALALLDKVDRRDLRLTDSVHILKSDLPGGTWSPLRDRYPEGEPLLPLDELIRYSVAQSDNNACDILLRLVGGPTQVEEYIRTLGISEITIRINEAQMQARWEAQFANHTTPCAMVRLLQLFAEQQILEAPTHAFLWETMVATVTGSVRTKLPPEAVVAHKTGLSGRNAEGVSAATNDVGILVRPDGRRIAYAIFITDSAESDATNYGIIAELGSMLYTL